MKHNESMSHLERIQFNGKDVYTHQSESNTLGTADVIHNLDGYITKKNYRNKLTVTGAVYMSEKDVLKRSTFNPPGVDIDLGVVGSVSLTNENLKEERIFGVVCGDGGVTLEGIKQAKPHHKIIPGLKPLRVVDIGADLIGAERQEYALRVVSGGKVYYYAKIFTSSITKVLFQSGAEVPLNVDQMTTVDIINVFNEYSVYISQKDLREYHINMYGNTNLCTLSSVGLLAGYPVTGPDGVTEYRNVRCVTICNMDEYPLKSLLSDITINYRFAKK
jgi:hypothetical protein